MNLDEIKNLVIKPLDQELKDCVLEYMALMSQEGVEPTWDQFIKFDHYYSELIKILSRDQTFYFRSVWEKTYRLHLGEIGTITTYDR